MPTLDWRHKDDATRAVAKTVLKILRDRPELGSGERSGGKRIGLVNPVTHMMDESCLKNF